MYVLLTYLLNVTPLWKMVMMGSNYSLEVAKITSMYRDTQSLYTYLCTVFYNVTFIRLN